MAVILTLAGLDTATPINCQVGAVSYITSSDESDGL
jgi:hypothetical protein